MSEFSYNGVRIVITGYGSVICRPWSLEVARAVGRLMRLPEPSRVIEHESRAHWVWREIEIDMTSWDVKTLNALNALHDTIDT